MKWIQTAREEASRSVEITGSVAMKEAKTLVPRALVHFSYSAGFTALFLLFHPT